MDRAVARIIDENGSLAIRVMDCDRANVRERVPVEADAIDSDGQPVHVLLHVVDGYLNELELYRNDLKPVLSFPSSTELQVSEV